MRINENKSGADLEQVAAEGYLTHREEFQNWMERLTSRRKRLPRRDNAETVVFERG